MVTCRLVCARPRRASGMVARPAAMPTWRRNCRLDLGLLDMCRGLHRSRVAATYRIFNSRGDITNMRSRASTSLARDDVAPSLPVQARAGYTLDDLIFRKMTSQRLYQPGLFDKHRTALIFALLSLSGKADAVCRTPSRLAAGR